MASKKTKAIIGAAAAAAAIAAVIYGAKKIHEKGYDKEAVKRLKRFSNAMKKEAQALAKKKAPAKKKTTKRKTTKRKTTRRKPARKKKR